MTRNVWNVLRGRWPRSGRLTTIHPAVTVTLVLGTLVAIVASGSLAGDDAGCHGDRPEPIRVTVAPEVAYVLTSALQDAAAHGGYCLGDAAIVPADPGGTVRLIGDGGPPPDVWIPDSSVWLDQSDSKIPVPSDPPQRLVTSPLVIAVPMHAVDRLHGEDAELDITDLLPERGQPTGPVRWVLPQPDQSAATVGAMLAMQSATTSRSDGNAVVSTVIRGSSQDVTSATGTGQADQALAIPMREQQVYAHNLDHPVARLAAVYPGGDEFVFDYPFAVLTDDPVRRGAAEMLFRTLRGEAAQEMMSDAGFRTLAGAGFNGETSPDSRAFAQVPDPDRVEAAQAAYYAVLRPSRLLALMDVSGSMDKPVLGAHGATRLQLAIQAAINGLASYPDDTVVGMWAFATNLTATTDYRELAPLEPLGRGPDGVSGRERLTQALAHVAVPKGPHRTGLYDSVLAAVREVQRTWDPDRVNSVVVITDGADSDRDGISLPKLLQTLTREHDATKPVAVYSIAYGGHGDPESLRKISGATEGKSYAAPDPRLIGEVLRDAVGRRACSSDC